MTSHNGVVSSIVGKGLMDGVWDDTELIRAYDSAVKSWRQSGKEKVETETTAGPGPWVEVSKPAKESELEVHVAAQQGSFTPGMLEVGSWIVGAPCRALYSADGQEYEAKIVGMEGPHCTIRFVGYGNEELIHLAELKTTHGKKSRDKQRRDAQMYNQSSNGAAVDVDCQSNISLTSSMCNNYTDSICRDRDLEETLTDTVLRTPLQSSTPQTRLSRPARDRNLRGRVFGNYKLTTPNFNQAEPADNVDSAIPSAAEATIDSSSERSSQADGEEPQEMVGNGTGTNGQWENFSNTMPQIKFPVPPMPLSLSKGNGSFDFGRGEMPALLMSWYMAGYQAGCFDAKHEIASSSNGNGNRVPKSAKRKN